ncbi:MAG: inorganic diphosphatase [bacterium]
MSNTFDMIVECPRKSRNKIEWDEEAKGFRFSRMLFTSTQYPAEYGFIPNSLASDGDPADIMALTGEPTFTGCIIEVKVIGILKMIDDGVEDFKMLAVPVRDPHYSHIKTLKDVPQDRLNEIEHFFKVYKDLENKKVVIKGWDGRKKALSYLKKSIKRYANDSH